MSLEEISQPEERIDVNVALPHSLLSTFEVRTLRDNLGSVQNLFMRAIYLDTICTDHAKAGGEVIIRNQSGEFDITDSFLAIGTD